MPPAATIRTSRTPPMTNRSHDLFPGGDGVVVVDVSVMVYSCGRKYGDEPREHVLESFLEFGENRSSAVRGAHDVFGGLAHLPIAVGERSLQGGLDIVAVEWRQRQDSPSSDGRLVGAAVKNRRQASNVADGTERGNARFAHQRIMRPDAQIDQGRQHVVVDHYVLAACPRRGLDD